MNLLVIKSPETTSPENAVNRIPLAAVQPMHNVSEFPVPFTSVTHHAPMYTEGCVAAGCPEDLF